MNSLNGVWCFISSGIYSGGNMFEFSPETRLYYISIFVVFLCVKVSEMFRPWGWRQYFCSNLWYSRTKQYGVITHKSTAWDMTVLFNNPWWFYNKNAFNKLFGCPFVSGAQIAVHKCQVALGGASESISWQTWRPFELKEWNVTFSFWLTRGLVTRNIGLKTTTNDTK